MARPEDFGAVKKVASVRPEDFGATPVERISAKEFGMRGIITPDEESGMVQPTEDQLAERNFRGRLQAVVDGKMKYDDLTNDEKAKLHPDGGNYEDFVIPPRGDPQAYLSAAQPGGAKARQQYGMKASAEGKANYLQETLGQEKPVVGHDGALQVFDSATGQYVPFEGGFDQTLGESIGGMPNIVASAIPGGQTVPGQAAAGAVGSVLKQGISALLPGKDNMSFYDRAKDVTGSALFAGITQGVVNGIAKGIEFLSPKNIIARNYLKAQSTPAAKQGADLTKRLQARTGDKFLMTVAEETQDPWLLGLQANAEQTFQGKRHALKFYNDRIKTAFKLTSETVEDLARGSTKDPAQFGEYVKNNFTKAVDSAYDAAYKFGEEAYAPFNGNKNQIPLTPLLEKLNDLKETYSPLNTMLKKGMQIGNVTLKEGDDMLTVSQLADTRRILSKVSRGKGKLFDGLDSQGEKHVAKELLRAVEATLDKGADWLQDPALKGALARANEGYKAHMDVVRGLKGTVLGKALKTDQLKAGETITDALLRAKPSEIEAVLRITEFDDPVFHQGLKEQYASGLLRAGKAGAKDMPIGFTPFNPRTAFQDSVGKDDTFKIIFKNGKERAAYNDVVRFNQRAAQFMPQASTGLKPAQEAQEGAAIVGGMATGNMSSAAVFFPKWYTKWYMGRTAAKMMFDPAGQKALRTLATADPTSKAFMSAMTYTMERTLAEPEEEDVSQYLPEQE